MAYTPINWQNGDTITAEKMNKMDNGWGAVDAQLFSGSITMIDSDGFHYAELPYSGFIDADSLTVTFDGTEYVCPKTSQSEFNSYGASGDYSVYPFGISSDTGGNYINTQTGGTHSVTVVATNTEVGDEFKTAVAKADPSFQIVLGQTTWEEAHNALNNGRDVYVLYDNGDKASFLYVGSNQSGDYVARGIRLTSSNDAPYVVQLSASSPDGVLQ